MTTDEVKLLTNYDLIGQLISHAHIFGDFVQESKIFADEILCRLESQVGVPKPNPESELDKIIEDAFKAGKEWGVCYGGWFIPTPQRQAEELESAKIEIKEKYNIK